MTYRYRPTSPQYRLPFTVEDLKWNCAVREGRDPYA